MVLERICTSDQIFLYRPITTHTYITRTLPAVLQTVAFLARSLISRGVPSVTGLGASAMAKTFPSSVSKATILAVLSPLKFLPSISFETSPSKAAEHLAPSQRSGDQESGMGRAFKFWTLTRIGFPVQSVTTSSILTLSRYWISTRIAWRER